MTKPGVDPAHSVCIELSAGLICSTFLQPVLLGDLLGLEDREEEEGKLLVYNSTEGEGSGAWDLTGLGEEDTARATNSCLLSPAATILSGLEEEAREDFLNRDLGFRGGSRLAGVFSGLVEECRLSALRTVTGDLVGRVTKQTTTIKMTLITCLETVRAAPPD